MSRRENEFRHRTSIFEGAFRAWSHLGGVDPYDLETKSPRELDPLDFPLRNDDRGVARGPQTANSDGSIRRHFPYEPLPRTGLSHPYVKAILSPWLGEETDREDVEQGLSTLRTWWQHRRKGENKSAIRTLGTDKMREIVNKYTRHFFDLAHCLVVSDNVIAPRTLHNKLRLAGNSRRADDSAVDPTNQSVDNLGEDASLTPLERIRALQQPGRHSSNETSSTAPIVNVRGKCIPGKIDLPGMVDAVTRQATQRAHRGGLKSSAEEAESCGDPNTTPFVFVSQSGDIQVLVDVNGITCAHCVKIVETVLKGCHGGKSPIEGLLDAAADRDLSTLMIRIDSVENAKRIAFEAVRNLSMVGYTAKPKEINLKNLQITREEANNVFQQVARAYPVEFFDWYQSCSCPDSGVFRGNCNRHSQMRDIMFEFFKAREDQILSVLQSKEQPPVTSSKLDQLRYSVPSSAPDCNDDAGSFTLDIEQTMEFPFPKSVDMEPIAYRSTPLTTIQAQQGQQYDFREPEAHIHHDHQLHDPVHPQASRNMSLLSDYGGAMGNISALAIDWEALPMDFAVDTANNRNPVRSEAPSTNGLQSQNAASYQV